MSHIFRSSLLLAFFFGLEKILGFARHLTTARQFGLSSELDAFNAANNLPDLLFALISGGALALAFIPVLSEYLEKDGRQAAWDLFSRITNLTFLVTAGLSIIIAILAEQLVRWEIGIAPGFDASQKAMVVDLMRLNLIGTLIFSISGLIMAGLQANQHFFLPALALSAYDVGGLFGVFILAPETSYNLGPITLPAFGMGIYGLVYGIVLGSLLHLCVQIPGLIHYQFRWKPAINLHHPGVRKVLTLLGPRLLTVFFIQLVFLVRDNFASRLETGAVTALAYGWLIMQVPETLIGTAIGTALLPTLSETIARGEDKLFQATLNKTVRIILALTLPTATLLAVVIRPLISIFNFGPQGTEMVVWTTRAYLSGIIGHSLVEVGARAFYAKQNARTPLLASAIMTVSYILLTALFFSHLSAGGIALANALAFTGEALLLILLLNRKFEIPLHVGSTLLRVIPATCLGSLVCFGVLHWLPVPPLATIGQILLACGAFAVGILTVLPWIWKQEIKQLISL